MYKTILLLLICFLFISCLSVTTTSSQETADSVVIPKVSKALAGRDYILTVDHSAPITGDRFKSESVYGSHSDSIGFKNVPLKIVLAALLDQDTTDIESSNMISLNRNIDLAFKSKRSDNSENPSIILDALCKRFSFTLEKTSRKPETWHLLVEDLGKLTKDFAGASETKKLVTQEFGDRKMVTLENNDLTALSEGLSQLCDLKIVNKADINPSINLKLNFKDINDLHRALNEYGISIKKSEDRKPYRFIRFN